MMRKRSAVKQDAPAAKELGTILLVDDSAVIRSEYGALLRLSGFRVVAARSGREALRLLAAAAVVPDLLLTDFRMPGMNGVELALHVRQRHPAMQVLLVSSFPEFVERARRLLPFATCLRKSSHPDQLVASVDRLLARKRAAPPAG